MERKKIVDATHLVLSCMDYRCTNDIVREIGAIIEGPDPNERYDHLILAGASLGVLQPKFPAWSQTFWEQLAVAQTLHTKIHTLVLLEHMECGAYGVFFEELHGMNPDEHLLREAELHDRVSSALAQLIELRTRLKVERWILVKGRDADGSEVWHPQRLPLNLEA